MKVIHIQGAENTGKTTLCNRIVEWLRKEGVQDIPQKYEEDKPKKPKHKELKDFRAIYEKNSKKILVNTLSDDIDVIKNFETFYKDNQGVDVLITAIRPSHSDKKENDLHQMIKDVYNQSEDLVIDMEKSLEEIVNQIQKFFHIVKNL